MTDTTNLAQRIQRLEDIEAIKHVTAIYAFHVNTGWSGKALDIEGLSAVFAEDVRWKSAATSVDAVGREAVVKMLKGATADFELAMHSFTNPILELDGDRAKGNWLLWVAIKTKDGVNQVFQSEDLRYVRTSDGWRIQSIDLHFGAMAK